MRKGPFFNSEGLPSHLCDKLTDESEMMRVVLLLALNARVRYFVQLKRSRRGKVPETRFALNIEGRQTHKA